MDKNQFERDPRAFAMELAGSGLASAESLLSCALKYMSCDDVRDMLDCSELSPRFDEEEEDDEEDEDESEANQD